MKTQNTFMLRTRSHFDFLRRATASTLLATLLLSCAALGWSQTAVTTAPRSELSVAEKELASNIRTETIRELVSALAADDMQGRGTAQPGGDKAANFLAERFAKLTLKPLGTKNSYLQPVKFKDSEFLPETNFKFGDQTLKLGADFVPMPPYSGDENASGPLHFIAYGMVTASLKRNDVLGLNLSGKIVVLLEGPPRIVNKASWKKARAQIDIITALIGAGVAGIVFISHGREERPFAEVANYLTRRQVERADSQEFPSELPPFVSLSNEAADRLFTKSGTTRADALAKAEAEGFKPIDLKQIAKITVRIKKGKGIGNNVIGLMEGSDPNLKSEPWFIRPTMMLTV